MTSANSTAAADRQPRKRPGPSGTPDIRKGILDASEYLFATQGFAATSIREIAERVAVNPAMVHYYFGSKKKLLQAVMEQVLEPMAGAVAKVEQRGDLPVRELTRLLFSMAADHPYLPQLITREVFLPGGELQSEFLQRFAPRLGGRLPGMLRREQREGRVAPDVDPQTGEIRLSSFGFESYIFDGGTLYARDVALWRGNVLMPGQFDIFGAALSGPAFDQSPAYPTWGTSVFAKALLSLRFRGTIVIDAAGVVHGTYTVEDGSICNVDWKAIK